MTRSLFIVVVTTALILGGLWFVVVPNLLKAMQRSNQKRGVADIRAVATAWEARAIDVKTYAIGAKSHDPIDATGIVWNQLTPVPPDALRRALQPTYLRTMPLKDIYGRPLEFAAADHTYAIRSLGRDGRPDSVKPIYVPAFTESFDADLVFVNGTLLRGPRELAVTR